MGLSVDDCRDPLPDRLHLKLVESDQTGPYDVCFAPTPSDRGSVWTGPAIGILTSNGRVDAARTRAEVRLRQGLAREIALNV